jgi:hypothetical protein
MKMPRGRWVLAFMLLAAGCTADSADRAPFSETSDVQQLMASVVEPAAEVYWDAVGWILDENGEEYFRPTTEEEWTAVRNAAIVLAESGDLLMMQSRAQGREDWIAMSRAMTEVSLRALAAAQNQDPDAVFDAGAEVYFTCTACHGLYAVETLRPNVDIDTATATPPGA